MSIDLKAHGLRVKSLEWRHVALGRWQCANYEVRPSRNPSFKWSATIRSVDFAISSSNNVDEAKATCQAHHESQVIALLESIEGGQ